MGMTERQSQLLKLVVEHYTNTGTPVGSAFLAELKELDVSGATVRNDLRDLEEGGFLTHPHTSAGRIPTEAGYRHYVSTLLVPREPKAKERETIEKILGEKDGYKDRVKQMARSTAETVHNAVIVAFQKQSLYYTGISELFSQPEFRDYAQTVEISTIFDQCEDRIDRLYELVEKGETKVLIGKENPLGTSCSLVARKISGNDLFIVLGPLRMDYARTIGLVTYMEHIV